MLAGSSITSIDKMRPFYEEIGIKMSASSNLLEKEVVQLFDLEQEILKKELNGKPVSLIYDGKKKYGKELLGVVARYLTEDFVINQKLLDLSFFNESIDNQKLYSSIINSANEKGILAKNVVGSICDRSSVNIKARKDFFKNFYVNCQFLECLSHTAQNTGKKIKINKLKKFIHNLRELIKNIKFTFDLKENNQKNNIIPSLLKECNLNKFFSEYEQLKDINLMWNNIVLTINSWESKKKKSKSLLKLVDIINDDRKREINPNEGSNDLFYAKLELKCILDFGSVLYSMCYDAEADGLTVIHVYDKIENIKKFIEKKEFPILTNFLISQNIEIGTQKFINMKNYCLDLLKDSFDYFETHFGEENGILKEEMRLFKFCRILQPSKCCEMITNGFNLNDYKDLKFFDLEFENISKEFEKYIMLCNQLIKKDSEDDEILKWWNKNQNELPNWSKLARYCFTLCSSSTAIERVFFLLDNRFGDQQARSSKELITVQLQTVFNKRKYNELI